MNDRVDYEDREELISRIFALLTGKLEDGAAIAAECQGRRPPDELRRGAALLEELVSEVATMAAAASGLLRELSSLLYAYDE